ncbi:MAG: metallophosphoesterase [Myxococcota bacterium]
MKLNAEIRFAHLSDWHATTLAGMPRQFFRGKRLSGWASWRFRRRNDHQPEILAAAQRDVHSQDLDRILVTGDLTHISLPSEFRRAAEQLRALGSPEEVFLIPGNHDCYVPVEAEEGWDHWSAYLRTDPSLYADPEIAALLAPAPGIEKAPCYADFPTLRIHGNLATIGLCSAIPTPVFRAGGELGAKQLERLEGLLRLLGERGLCRVVMIHHPVAMHGEPARRALWDGDALRALIARTGAELILHGHKHRRLVNWLEGPGTPVPVIGVPSSSEVGSKPGKRAQYHVYTIRPAESSATQRFEVSAVARAYDPSAGGFVAVPEPVLAPGEALKATAT